MNFSPYHSFNQCSRLEAVVQSLYSSGNIPDSVFALHERYHFSLVHKIRSARYHVETLKNYLNTQDSSRTNPADIAYRVNFHFDGFLYLLGSAADIFAREILVYYNEPLPNRVYFQTAYDKLNVSQVGNPVLPLIAMPGWKPEFNDYRNTATHENLIGTGFAIEFEIHGNVTKQRLRFPIPDDPRALAKTYVRNKDIVIYCEQTLKRILRLFNKAYGHVATAIDAAGHLPL